MGARLGPNPQVGKGNHMSTSTTPAQMGTGRLNKMAVAAVVLAAIALVALGLLGVAALAVFAVGAGHVSLNQIKVNGQRGRWLALVALGVGYAVGVAALVTALSYIPAVVQQLG